MNTWHRLWSNGAFRFGFTVLLVMLVLGCCSPLLAQGGEAELKLPDLSQAVFLGGVTGPTLLGIGLGVSLLGFVFGLMMYNDCKNTQRRAMERQGCEQQAPRL